MLNFREIIFLPYRIVKSFISEFYSVYYDVFKDRHQLANFLKFQLYILFATSVIALFATSLGNLKAIFAVYLIGAGIIAGFFAYFFFHLFGDKGIDYLWGFKGEPGIDELAQPYFHKVEFALREERYETALLLLEKVLELDPKQLKALMKIAQIYHHHLEDYPKALNTYKRIINILGWEEQSNFFYIEAKKGIGEIMKMFDSIE